MKIAFLVPRWRWIFHTIFEEFTQYINRPYQFEILESREIRENLDAYDWVVSPIKFQRTYENEFFKKKLREKFIAFLGGFECYERITDWRIFKYVWVLSNCLVKDELETTNYFVQPNGVDIHLFHPMNSEKKWFTGFVGNASNPRKRIKPWFIPICEQAGVNYHIHNGQSLYLNRNMLPQLYNQFECYMSTSLWEGGCNPVLEASACGLPIVSTDTGFACEFKREIYRCATPEAMVDALRVLRSSRELRDKMGVESRREIVEDWSCEKRSEEWMKKVESL